MRGGKGFIYPSAHERRFDIDPFCSSIVYETTAFFPPWLSMTDVLCSPGHIITQWNNLGLEERKNIFKALWYF
jgi:hypothetical protein